MDAPCRFRFRNALYTVYAALILQARIRARPFDGKADLLDPAELRLVDVVDIDFPAPAFGVHGVHAEKGAGEKRRLFAARAAADLNDDVRVVVQILWQKKNEQLIVQARHIRLRRLDLLFEHFAKIRVVGGFEQLFCLGERVFRLPVGAVVFDHRGKVFLLF